MTEGLVTDLDNFIESEYLHRELGLKFKFVSGESMPRETGIKGILTNNLVKWDSVLSNSPRSSIVVFLTGNEYYKKEKFEQLNLYQSISVAFVQYLPDKSAKFPFQFLLREIIQDPHLLRKKEFWRTLARALDTFRNLRNLQLQVRTHLLPLGYTNRFVDELRQIELVPSGSSILVNAQRRGRVRNRSIFFTGQKGSWLRRRIIDEFRSEQGVKIETYDGWGGGEKAVTNEYVNSLLYHKFCLCPPGNLCNDTPRYYEAICLASFPVLARVSLQDWNDFGHWPSICNKEFRNATSLEIYKRLVTLNEMEFGALLNRVLSHEIVKINKLRYLIGFELDKLKKYA